MTKAVIHVNEPPEGADPEFVAFSEDVFTMATQAATHWDALAHCSHKGTIYNGYPASSVTDEGAARCGIHRAGTVVSRGVLLDVARALGRDVLEPGHPIMPKDLDAACALGNVEPEPGDIVLVRTGQMVHLQPEHRDLVAYTWPSPGLTIDTAPWFHAHDVAAVATDTFVFEVYPCQYEDAYLPVHVLHLVEMGLTQGQNWVLDPLGRRVRRRRPLHVPARRDPAAHHRRPRLAAPAGRAQVTASTYVVPLRRRAVAPPSTGPVRGRVASRDSTTDVAGASRPVTAQCSTRACVSTRCAVRMPQNSKP